MLSSDAAYEPLAELHVPTACATAGDNATSAGGAWRRDGSNECLGRDCGNEIVAQLWRRSRPCHLVTDRRIDPLVGQLISSGRGNRDPLVARNPHRQLCKPGAKCAPGRHRFRVSPRLHQHVHGERVGTVGPAERRRECVHEGALPIDQRPDRIGITTSEAVQ